MANFHYDLKKNKNNQPLHLGGRMCMCCWF